MKNITKIIVLITRREDFAFKKTPYSRKTATRGLRWDGPGGAISVHVKGGTYVTGKLVQRDRHAT